MNVQRLTRGITILIVAGFLSIAGGTLAGGLIAHPASATVHTAILGVQTRVDAITPVIVLPVVECWEDLSCSDGSTLDVFECARWTYLDQLGRIVHSDGQCGPDAPVPTVYGSPDGPNWGISFGTYGFEISGPDGAGWFECDGQC